jgi:hypothetical protein
MPRWSPLAPTLLAALEPLARPADATDNRSGSQRHADALGGEIDGAGRTTGRPRPER